MGERKNLGHSYDIFVPDEPLRPGVLNNPLSGANRKGLRDVRKVLLAYPQVLHCDVQSPGDVASALTDFARREINLVVINGGDGTSTTIPFIFLGSRTPDCWSRVME